MDVCGRVGRGLRRDEAAVYREQQRKLKLATRLLTDIGFVDPDDTIELQSEARHLCAWLEGRERQAGIKRAPRRGQEYQQRLQQVLGFLKAVSSPEEEAAPPALSEPAPVVNPESVYKPTGVIDG